MSLFTRLSLLFTLILVAMGVIVWQIAHQSQQRYFEEKTQQLNRPIAMYTAQQVPLFINGQFDLRALSNLARHVMIINPGLKIYLLDSDGQVMATALESSKEQAIGTFVDLEPIRRFLSEPESSTIYGDDPEEPGSQRIFSAYPLSDAGIGGSGCDPCGYVYAVLASDHLPGIWQTFKSSQTSRYAAIILMVVTSCSLIVGIALFFMLTRPLRSMAREMGQWQLVANEPQSAISSSVAVPLSQNENELKILEDTCRQMAQRLSAQYKTLERTDQERRQLFTRLSHDLRTPLTSLNGVLETLSAEKQQTTFEQRQSYLSIAVRQSHRLQRLIDQIFDLARLDSGEVKLQLERFSFQEMIMDTVQECAPHAQSKGVQLRFFSENEECLVMVEGDISQLNRVIVNLISNAIRCTSEGGEIKVSTRLDERDNLKVSVADSGCGFARELHSVPLGSLDFSNDTAARQSSAGTGLGLSIVSRVLALHGTTATVSSKPGIGSLVCFSMKRLSAQHLTQ